MPRYLNKKTVTIFIGILVAMLILLGTQSTIGLPKYGSLHVEQTKVQPIKSITQILTKLYIK
ncbi:MAG: hypothetical protein ABJH05_10255 [Fulvivirga sp.]